jgi:cation diffusion facilitator family transporter
MVIYNSMNLRQIRRYSSVANRDIMNLHPVTTSPAAPHPAEQGMRSTLIGIGVNLLLVTGKATAGILGHSYALIADAIESGTDVLSSIVVFFGLKVAARPADENHPHGHGKAEPLAALVVALALFGAAIMIAFESIKQIRTPHSVPAAWTLAILVAVVVVKECLFRFVLKVGDEVGSTAVKGDAWHHRSDAITSAAAFIGISVALIGGKGWEGADDWAALVATLVIAFNGSLIFRTAIYELTDAKPNEALELEVRNKAIMVPGVSALDKCLIRKMGFDYYVELDIRVDPEMTVQLGHEIAHRVQDELKASITSVRIARVLVHVEPCLRGAENN